MNDEHQTPLLTRRGLVQHINDTLGVPLKLSRFHKLAMNGEALEPDAFYGRLPLYSPEKAEQWARDNLLTDKRSVLANPRRKQAT